MTEKQKHDYESVFTELPQTSEVNLVQILYRQLDRINMLLSTRESYFFVTAVLSLELTLSPYHDKHYTDFKKDIVKQQKALFEKFARARDNERSQSANIEFWAAQKKFSALMDLMHRKNILPIESTEGRL